MTDGDKLQVCWQAFSMENSLLQSYRTHFMMVEAALLALGFVLLQVYRGTGILVPAIIGWIVAIIWIILCEAKGKDVDRWRDRIIGLQSATGTDWFEYLKSGFTLQGGRAARAFFNYAIPILIAALWVIMVMWDNMVC